MEFNRQRQWKTYRKLVGIITNRDMRFVADFHIEISEVMTKNLVTAPVGTSPQRCRKILQQHKIEKLPIVDDARSD